MRAGVGAVQHTLTPAAASVVRAAVAEAKGRGHSQVQPLHVAAILLTQSSPGSPLRRACVESHNKDLSHPLQCRALELCFKIALDRLPSNQEKLPNPVLSNALVAALKRAQAHQRRGAPEQSLQPLLAVKVEMDQLIISILDDPSVSRVMREAGFSSTDVKTNMEEAAAQQSPSLTCSSSSLDSCGQLRRRERLPVTPFTCSPLEGVQFRHSLFSSTPSLRFESTDSNLRMVERGLLSSVADAQSDKESSLLGPFHRQDADGHSFSPLDPPLVDNSPLYLNRMEQSRLHVQAPVSLNRGSARSTGHEEDVRNVVETLSKNRNPVLVNDVGLISSSSVVKAFSQRLKNGDVPSFLKGVHVLNFPFNSLTVGLFSQDEMEQKLSQLRTLVEGSMPGGAILSLGDLQWLAETSQGKATMTHAHASLAIQELNNLLDTYSSQRFWLLATASSQTFTGCQSGSPSLETRLKLQPILIAANSGQGFHSRYGTYQSKVSGPLTSSGLTFTSNPLLTRFKFPGQETSLDDLDCCPECTIKYQNEVSRLIRQERTPPTGLSLPPSSIPQPPWMRQAKACTPVAAVKVEEDMFTHSPLLSQRIQDLKDNWRRICSGHSAIPRGLSTVTDSARSHHSSSQARESIISKDRSSSLMSKMMGMSNWPETSKFLVAKSAEQPSPLSSKVRSIPPWAISPIAVNSLSNRATTFVNINPDGPSNVIRGWMKKDNTSGARNASKRSSSPAQLAEVHRDTMGADLALGRSSPEVPSPIRDLREEGQQPIRGEFKLSIAGNSRQEPVPEVSLPWRVGTAVGTDLLKASEQRPPSGNLFRPNDMDSLKGLWRGLQDMVPWQREASSFVASTVSDCRSGNGRKRGSSTKSDTWLLFLGPDRVGKREVAKALAKLVFGDEKKLIWMQLGGNQVDSASLGSGMGLLTSDNNGVRYRGKTPLDRLVEAVRLRPFSVVLLEDVDQADSVVRGNLVRAMGRGKLASSNGKEVSFANVIVIMTCSVGGSLLSPKQNFEGQGALAFEEDKLSRLSSYGMKLQVDGSKPGKVLHDNGKGVSVLDYSLGLEDPSLELSPSASLSCKRRAHWALQGDADFALRQKRLKKEGSVSSKALALDLNLSAEENESVDEISCMTDANTPDRPAEQETEQALVKKVIASARDSLPEEMFDLVDAHVMFKSFDFATLTDGILEQLEGASRIVLNTGATMDIDVAVLEQLVSAAWQTNSDHKVFNSWVNDVLVKNLSSLPVKCEVGPGSVVKLMIDRVQALEMQESGAVRVGLLPASIKIGLV